MLVLAQVLERKTALCLFTSGIQSLIYDPTPLVFCILVIYRTNSTPSKQIILLFQYRPLFYFTAQFILYSLMLFLQRTYYLPCPSQAKCSGNTVLPNNIRLFIQ